MAGASSRTCGTGPCASGRPLTLQTGTNFPFVLFHYSHVASPARGGHSTLCPYVTLRALRVLRGEVVSFAVAPSNLFGGVWFAVGDAVRRPYIMAAVAEAVFVGARRAVPRVVCLLSALGGVGKLRGESVVPTGLNRKNTRELPAIELLGYYRPAPAGAGSCSVLSPAGTFGNSPPIHRGEPGRKQEHSPVGTTELGHGTPFPYVTLRALRGERAFLRLPAAPTG